MVDTAQTKQVISKEKPKRRNEKARLKTQEAITGYLFAMPWIIGFLLLKNILNFSNKKMIRIQCYSVYPVYIIIG